MPETLNSISDAFLFHSIHHFLIPRGESHHQPLHRHPDTAELLLVTEGNVQCRIGTQSYSLSSSTALLVPPGSWYELEYPAAQQQCGYRLSFTPPHLKTNQVTDTPQMIQVDDLAGVASLFVCLQQENDQLRPDSKQIIHHLVGLIVALLNRSTETQNSLNCRDVEKTIRLIKHYMEEHHCRSLTLEDLAAQFTMNKYQLARLFKQHTGISPLQYLISCRMDTAKQLLTATDSSVAAIASSVSYKSVTQFQAAFKKATGTTPRQFRVKQKR